MSTHLADFGAGRASAFSVRRGTPADDDAQRGLLGAVAMDADLALSIRRAPTVGALYALHARDWETWVVSDDTGTLHGMGAVLVRDGYVDGQVEPVGYLGDLRFSPQAEGRHLLDRAYGDILSQASDAWGCRYFLTAIIASNARALRALTVATERGRRRGRPRYTLLRDFDIRSLHLVLPQRRVRPPAGMRVRVATEGDVPALARLLDDDARGRPFGYPMDERTLRWRLATWPGLTIDRFHVVEGARGAIVGCAARWDATAVKQTVVQGYRGSMRRVRVLHDVVARLLRRPALPDPGGALRYEYLTHVAVPPRAPAVLRTLVADAHAASRRAGYQFLSVAAPAGDPLDAAYHGFPATNLRAGLYLVTLPGTPVPDIGPVMPGFEMALV